MKKTYVAPEMELYRIETQQMLALSIKESNVTKDNEQDYEQYSHSFEGGIVFDNDDNE